MKLTLRVVPALRLLLFLGRWDDAMRIVNKRVRTQPSEAHDRHEQVGAATGKF